MYLTQAHLFFSPNCIILSVYEFRPNSVLAKPFLIIVRTKIVAKPEPFIYMQSKISNNQDSNY